MSIFVLVVFGGPAAYCFHQIRVLHRATICYNAEGLWLARLGKEKGLVRWLDVKSTRDREAVNRLELLDRQGKVLIGLEHQLEGYGSLKKIIYTKLRGPNPQVELPVTFDRSVILQNLCIGISLFGAAISIVAMISDHLNGRESDHIFWGVLTLLFAAFGLSIHLTTPEKLIVSRDGLERHFPLSTQTFALSKIGDFRTLWKSGHRQDYECVEMELEGEDSPIQVSKGIAMSSDDLCRELKLAVEAARQEAHRRAKRGSKT